MQRMRRFIDMLNIHTTTLQWNMIHVFLNPLCLFQCPISRLSSKFTQSLSSSVRNFPTPYFIAGLKVWFCWKEEGDTNPNCSLLCLYWFQYSHFLLHSLFVVARSFRTSICLSHQIKNVLFGWNAIYSRPGK